MRINKSVNVMKRLLSVEYRTDIEMYPEILTNEVPGPLSKKMMTRLHNHIDMRLMNVFVDLDRSYGNFCVDVDGNTFLDLHQHFSSLPFGYNYELFRSEADLLLKYAINKSAMGVFPPEEYLEVVEDIMERINPGELNDLIPLNTGAEAIENSIKLSTIYHHFLERGKNDDYSTEQLNSCMNNQTPGSSKAVILSFDKGFHGRSLGANTCTSSKQIAKLDVSAFDWPIAPFPQLLYPLNENMEYNREEEIRCLSSVEEIIKIQTDIEEPVAGIIIEPIQSDGGDRHTTPFFFQDLQKICRKEDISLILDEVQTGIAITGKMWCFEHFDLDEDPDILCFSKKSQLAGVLSKKGKYRPEIANRVNSTWHGDMLRAKMMQMILQEIEEKDIMNSMTKTGEFLMNGLNQLSEKYQQLENVRGIGCFVGFDCDTVDNRGILKELLRQNGVLVNIAGERAIRLRPCLRFENQHASIFLELLEKSLNQML